VAIVPSKSQASKSGSSTHTATCMAQRRAAFPATFRKWGEIGFGLQIDTVRHAVDGCWSWKKSLKPAVGRGGRGAAVDSECRQMPLRRRPDCRLPQVFALTSTPWRLGSIAVGMVAKVIAEAASANIVRKDWNRNDDAGGGTIASALLVSGTTASV
jgi:hypothetical protein